MIKITEIKKINFKKFALIGGVILIIILIFTLIGYFKNKKVRKNNEQEIVNIEGQEEITPQPVLVLEKDNKSNSKDQKTEKTEAKSQTSPLKYKQLFNKTLMYLEADYPLIYVYDPEEEVIKYIDLESEVYRELFRTENLNRALFSYDKQKVIIENDNELFLLDIKNDTLTPLPPFTKNYVFTLNKPVLYLTDGKSFSYLAYLENDGRTTSLRKLGILNPELIFLPPNYLLIYNNLVASPVFLLDLKNPSNLDLFIEEEDYYSILPNKNGDLLFISSSRESKIIDLKKNILMTFPWVTAKEKCSFKEVLICSVSDIFDYINWQFYNVNFDNKIIIYDINKNTSKEIKIEPKFDIINPQLTSEGIIFGNRLDGKIYLLKVD